MCNGHQVSLNGQTFLKRTPRVTEMVTINAPPEELDGSGTSASDYYKLTSDTTESTATAPYFWDRDCVTLPAHNSGLDSGVATTLLDLNLNNYTQNSVGSKGLMKSGSQSSNLFGLRSSENCISRFGVQDSIGNSYEFTSNILNCTDWGCSYTYNDLSRAIGKLSPDWYAPQDRNSANDFKALDGEYLYWAKAAVAPSASVHKTPASSALFSTAFGDTAAPYFNPVIGQYYACFGTSCSNKQNDNVRITTLDSASAFIDPTYTKIYDFYTYGDTMYSPGFSASQTNYAHIASGGGFPGSTQAGRWYSTTGDLSTIQAGNFGGRCLVRFEENNNSQSSLKTASQYVNDNPN